MAKRKLTLEQLKEELVFDPDSGTFLRLRRTSNRIKVGEIAGCIRSDGYRQIMILGIYRFAHRLHGDVVQ